jgi:hypothetical protein
MILVVVCILKKEPVQGARRVRTGERLPCRKVFEVLLMHVSGECERVRETPCPDTRRQTDIA